MRRTTPGREKIFNAPWPALALVLSLPAAFLIQTQAPDAIANGWIRDWGLSPRALFAGRWEPLFTSLWLHGSWAHVLVNAVFIFAFASPLARLFGPSVRGLFGFALFYLLCGALAGLGFAALHPQSDIPLVGASGAGSGLFAAALRLMAGRGRIGPILSRSAVAASAAFVVVNVILGVTNLTPGAGDMPVAWEAHLFGFASGLLLIQPLAAAFAAPQGPEAGPDIGPWGAAPR